MGINLSPLVLETFDFDKIVERLVSLCSSSPAQELARSITPFPVEEVYLRTQEAREALDMVQFDGALSFRGLSDLGPLFFPNRSGGFFPELREFNRDFKFFSD